MNITIVTPIFPPRTGGPSTYVWELVHRLKNSHKITIVCFSNNPEKISGVEIVNIKTLGNFFTRQSKLLNVISGLATKTDLFYIQGPLVVGLAGTLIAMLYRKPSFVKFVGDEVWETDRLVNKTQLTLEEYYQHPPITKVLHIFLERLVLKNSQIIITPSQYLKRFLVHYHHVNPRKIKVIFNAIKLRDVSADKKSNQLITVGRLVPWKNIDTIIKSLSLASKAKPWCLIIVGEGPQKKRLQDLAVTLHVQDKITFTGRVSHQQTLEYIAKSKTLILYSDYEGLSHTLIEAMLSKTDIIASDIAPNREATNGFASFVPLNSPDHLAKTINKSKSFTNSAFEYAQENYSWQNHITQLEKLLHEHYRS